jgi:hypothetical protein
MQKHLLESKSKHSISNQKDKFLWSGLSILVEDSKTQTKQESSTSNIPILIKKGWK